MIRLAHKLQGLQIVWAPEHLLKHLNPNKRASFRSVVEGASPEALASYLLLVLTPRGAAVLEGLSPSELQAVASGDLSRVDREAIEATPRPLNGSYVEAALRKMLAIDLAKPGGYRHHEAT